MNNTLSSHIHPLTGRRGGTRPRADPSSTGCCEPPSPCTCSSSCCWSWPASCLCLKRTTAAHCPTTSPDLSTPCCATPTAPRPHDHCLRPSVGEVRVPVLLDERGGEKSYEVEIPNRHLNNVKVQEKKKHGSSCVLHSNLYLKSVFICYYKSEAISLVFQVCFDM